MTSSPAALVARLAVAYFASVLSVGFGDYLASRDPVSLSAYALALLLFAAMPAAVARRPN
ncbi:MAG TPA: hypothetical protein VMU03_08100 [Gammaproteobacteria bacterium]|jgi:hypothetical protein|nr:hypothetical protein [Gammaproteobacteria bacterium]